MSIGKNIKRIRREKGITQEKLAELLGLTPSAVSQWETDRVLPDITQLPMLCSIFDVTSDEILGISNDSKMQEIDRITDEAYTLIDEGEYEVAVETVRRGLKKYPDSYGLMQSLAFCLEVKDHRESLDERIDLYKKIINNTDDQTKNWATGNLCRAYAEKGENDKALELADSVVELIYTRDNCRLFALRDTMQWVDESCVQINKTFEKLIYGLFHVARIVKYRMNDEDALELWRKIFLFIETFFEKGDYGNYYEILLEGCYDAAHRSASLGDCEQALYYLEKMVSYVKELEHYFVDPNKRLGCSIWMPVHSSLVPSFDESDTRLLHIPEVERFVKKAYDMMSSEEFIPVCEKGESIKAYLKEKCEQLAAYIKVNSVEECPEGN
ncbi:MAG: helix-turn-helix transcriptional regulator [Clostridia bacterium]|nr:helix-turn-helix transcriptional regulator [Clostridia bacterium]